MTRKIGLHFSTWNGKRLEQIRNAASGFELVDLSSDYFDKNVAECEILFGFIGADILKAATNLKWLHSQSAGLTTTSNLKQD